MNFNELYPKKKEYYYLLMDIKTTAECNVSNCVIDKQKAKLLMRYINEKEKEKQRLNNIINELEKYINETKLEEFEKVYGRRYGKTFTQAEVIICNMILNKLQELKGSGNNE